MHIRNQGERDTIKQFLSGVMSDSDLREQFANAQKRQKHADDHTEFALRQYMGILTEIQQERAARPKVKPDATGPSLAQLKKKYGGSKP